MKTIMTFALFCVATMALAGPTMPNPEDVFVIRAFSPDTNRAAAAEARIQRCLKAPEVADQKEAFIAHVSDLERPHGVIVLKDRTVYLWRL